MTFSTSSFTIPINGYFNDPEGEPLTYTLASNNPSIATGAINNNESMTITRVGNNTGNVVITITAIDVHGATAFTSFSLLIV